MDAADPLDLFDAAQGAGGRGCRQAGHGMFRDLLGDRKTWRRTFFRYQLLITFVDDDA